MGLHSRAWSGLKICVLGSEPMWSMRIEQAISAATPANEVRIESFDDYGDAYQFCKNNKDIGLLILSDRQVLGNVEDVFRELSRHYETTGLPCFGTILAPNTGPNVTTMHRLMKSENILDYVSDVGLFNVPSCQLYLKELWHSFLGAFERTLLPTPLQETLKAAAEATVSTSSIIAYERITNLLVGSLNVSWMEVVAIRWSLAVRAAFLQFPFLESANPGIRSLISLTQARLDHADTLSSIASSKSSLAARVASVGEFIVRKGESSQLDELAVSLQGQNSPGKPALIRLISGHWHHLRRFYEEKDTMSLAG